MGQRPDEIGRDPGRRDPLDADDRATGPLPGEPGFDPATDAFEPDAVIPGPALGTKAEVDEVEVTRVEIERTRAGMSETVDAIQERLSPENLKEQAKDRVKEATVGKAQEAGSGIVDTIRQNPLPAALTGIGLGWLFVERQKAECVPAALPGCDLPGWRQRRGLSSRLRLPAALRGRERLLGGPGSGQRQGQGWRDRYPGPGQGGGTRRTGPGQGRRSRRPSTGSGE